MKDPEQSSATHPPVIDEVMLAGVIHDIQSDPEYLGRVLHIANEQHGVIIKYMMSEAYNHGEGDLDKQVSFIRGAEFILAIFQKRATIESLQAQWGPTESSDLIAE